MLKVVFKNMESSHLAISALEDKINPVIQKFKYQRDLKISVVVELENRADLKGPDLFNLTSIVSGKAFKGQKIKRVSSNFYNAVSHLAESLDEYLSTEGENLIDCNKKNQNRRKFI